MEILIRHHAPLFRDLPVDAVQAPRSRQGSDPNETMAPSPAEGPAPPLLSRRPPGGTGTTATTPRAHSPQRLSLTEDESSRITRQPSSSGACSSASSILEEATRLTPTRRQRCATSARQTRFSPSTSALPRPARSPPTLSPLPRRPPTSSPSSRPPSSRPPHAPPRRPLPTLQHVPTLHRTLRRLSVGLSRRTAPGRRLQRRRHSPRMSARPRSASSTRRRLQHSVVTYSSIAAFVWFSDPNTHISLPPGSSSSPLALVASRPSRSLSLALFLSLSFPPLY